MTENRIMLFLCRKRCKFWQHNDCQFLTDANHYGFSVLVTGGHCDRDRMVVVPVQSVPIITKVVSSMCTPVFFTNKTVHHYITEILLKAALSTINQPNQPSVLVTNWFPKSHLKKGGTSFLCGGFCTFLICYQIISVIVIECLWSF